MSIAVLKRGELLQSSDTFDRADSSSLGSDEQGHTWISNGFAIAGNRARCTTASATVDGLAFLEMVVAARLYATNAGASDYVGMQAGEYSLRWVNPNDATHSTLQLFFLTSMVGQITVAPIAAGSVFELRIEGSAVSVRVNSVVLALGTTNQTIRADTAGIFSKTSGAGVFEFDDFWVEADTSAAPVAPTNLVAAASVNREIWLSWYHATAADFALQRATSPSGPWTPPDTSWRVRGQCFLFDNGSFGGSLAAATRYYYRVRAISIGGNNIENAPPSVPSDVASAMTNTISQVFFESFEYEPFALTAFSFGGGYSAGLGSPTGIQPQGNAAPFTCSPRPLHVRSGQLPSPLFGTAPGNLSPAAWLFCAISFRYQQVDATTRTVLRLTGFTTQNVQVSWSVTTDQLPAVDAPVTVDFTLHDGRLYHDGVLVTGLPPIPFATLDTVQLIGPALYDDFAFAATANPIGRVRVATMYPDGIATDHAQWTTLAGTKDAAIAEQIPTFQRGGVPTTHALVDGHVDSAIEPISFTLGPDISLGASEQILAVSVRPLMRRYVRSAPTGAGAYADSGKVLDANGNTIMMPVLLGIETLDGTTLLNAQQPTNFGGSTDLTGLVFWQTVPWHFNPSTLAPWTAAAVNALKLVLQHYQIQQPGVGLTQFASTAHDFAVDVLISSPAGGQAPPAAPTNLTATPTSTTAIRLNWQDNSNDEDSFDVYEIVGGTPLLLASLPPNTVTWTHTGLSPGTTHTYQVCAVKQTEIGPLQACSNTASATTPSGSPGSPPAAPTNLVLTVLAWDRIKASWTDNASDEDGSEIERADESNPAAFAVVGSVAANVTTFTDTGLSELTIYFYRVRARNLAGYSSYTATKNERTPARPVSSAPAAPTGLTVTSGGLTSLVLAWTDNAVNEDRYEIQRAEDLAGVAGEFSPLAEGGINATGYTDGNLSPATSWWYRVRAANAQGGSDWAGPTRGTTDAISTPPDAPIHLTATATGPHTIDLAWEPQSSFVATYVIERATVLGTFVAVATVGVTTAYTDVGLTPDTTYTYRIRAVNVAGASIPSDDAQARTFAVSFIAAPPPEPVCDVAEVFVVTGTAAASVRQASAAIEHCHTPAASFELSVSSPTAAVPAGRSGTALYTATVTPRNGWNGPVSFALAGLPAGSTAGFSPMPVTVAGNVPGASTLTITHDGTSAAGAYQLLLTATGSGVSETLPLEYVVQAGVQRLLVTVSPSPRTLTGGVSGSVQYTVTVQAFGMPDGDATLSLEPVHPGPPVILSSSGLSEAFSQNPVAVTESTPGRTTLTISHDGSQPEGTYTLTVHATMGGITATGTATLIVTVPPAGDFELEMTPRVFRIGA